jgi:hypothetical protein
MAAGPAPHSHYHESPGTEWLCEILTHTITHVYSELGTMPTERQCVAALNHELVSLGPEIVQRVSLESPVPVLFQTSSGQTHLLGTDRIDLLLETIDEHVPGGVRRTIIEVKTNTTNGVYLSKALTQARRYSTLLQTSGVEIHTICGIVYPKEGTVCKPIFKVIDVIPEERAGDDVTTAVEASV